MSRETRPFDAGPDGGDDLEALLRLAGPREPAPAERLARLRSGAHADWQRMVTTRRRRRMLAWSLVGLTAAAGLVLSLGVEPTVGPPASAPPVVATLVSLTGTAQLALGEGGTGGQAAPGEGLTAGRDVVVTGTGVVTLRLTSGGLVLLSNGTSARLVSAERVVLSTGRVYAETGGHGMLAVETRLGIVRDIGTRFEVRLTPLALRVRVRDGGVRLSRALREYEAGPGEEITVEAAGAVSERTVAVDGAPWAWTTGEAVPFDIEGRSAHEFLAWLADENDWQLRYDDGAAEQKARATTLHGSIRELTVDQSLAAVLPASGIDYRRDGRVLVIRLVRGDPP